MPEDDDDPPFTPTSILERIGELLKTEESVDGRRVLKRVSEIVEDFEEKWIEKEERRKKQSTRVTTRMKAENKKVGGDLPYGKMLDENGVDLRDHPSEQRVIAAARTYYAQGASLRGVARQLKEIGLLPREKQNDDEFYPVQISRMLDENVRRSRNAAKQAQRVTAKKNRRRES